MPYILQSNRPITGDRWYYQGKFNTREEALEAVRKHKETALARPDSTWHGAKYRIIKTRY